jgi:hypothetical protein
MATSPSGSPDKDVARAIEDPFLRRSVMTALHLRRYLPFYVFGTIWVITLAMFPSIRGGDDGDRGGPAAGSDLATTDVAGTTDFGSDGTAVTTDPGLADPAAGGDPAVAAAAGGGVARPAGGTTRTATAPGGGGGTTAAASAPPAPDAIQRETGTARLGFECKPGVPQVPGASYAAPCQNKYDGPNGGATFRGVTDKEILIIDRVFPESPNSRAVAEVNKQAGFADPEVRDAIKREFIDYFNKTYELYGRQVKYVEYESENGDSTAEAQSKGKEGACLDAEKIVKEFKAFGVDGASQPFAECVAERKLVAFRGASYFPERLFQKHHPFIWNTTMECERISLQTAEYMGKRLVNKPAKFAGDVALRAKPRKFGTYVPDNDGYQHCVSLYKKYLRDEYGHNVETQYNYQLDISRFPDQAAQASVQFAAAGVTTVVLACDYISVTVLTAAATQQRWFPEWFTIGVGGVDLDNTARLYDQEQVNGHLFGLSQLGDAVQLIGPKSEPGQVYKLATGKTMPEGTNGEYFSMVHLFNLLQAAGPNLTPNAIADGVVTIPVRGAAPFPAGRWSFADKPDGSPGLDHTAVQDAREVYWVSEPGTDTAGGRSARDTYYNGPDGKNGTFKVTYDGNRFVTGAWPAEDPPVYPPR